MEKSCAFIDVSNTAYDGYLALPLIKAQVKHGFIDGGILPFLETEVAEAREGGKKMSVVTKNILDAWAQALSGVSYPAVLEHCATFLASRSTQERFFKYLPSLLEDLRPTHDVFFVSAEPQFVGRSLVEHFWVKGHLTSVFDVRSGQFTENPPPFYCIAPGERRRQVMDVLDQYENPADSIGLGDSSADLEFLHKVRFPVLVDWPRGGSLKHLAARKTLHGQVRALGWPILHPNKIVEVVRGNLGRP